MAHKQEWNQLSLLTKRNSDWKNVGIQDSLQSKLWTQYIHAYIDPDKTNSMKKRTFPGIYLGPTGNLQGTVKVLDLNTGKVKKPKTFTEVLMPYSVIKLVNN